MILGIDEVGRGPWAGPLVVGAVILGGEIIDGLTDSKKLSKKKREILDKEIREKAKGFGLGWVQADEIDKKGLSESLRLATKRAVEQIKAPYHQIIIDGTVNFLSGTNKESYVTTIKKADILVPCVSAASIIAKVARDKFMSDQDRELPGYDFSSHVGYGTARHKAAISKLGATKLHRMSFSPLKDIKKTTKKIGDEAEDVAAEYLIRSGHEILNRNWKTKFCEIDIVSTKNNIIYFCEVKYRKSNQHGCGMDVITGRKVDKMKFAARLYIHNKKLTDIDLRLMAMSMTGTPPNVIECIEV